MENQAEQSPDPYRLTADQQQLFNRAMWIVLGIGIGWLLFADKEGYLTNVFTELLGVAGTFFVLDYWIRRRDERQKVEELKAQLLRQVRSTEPTIARHAIHEMRERGLLTGNNALLEGEKLTLVKWQKAKLEHANLRRADLWGADLEGANLLEADLQEANLRHANLKGAWLTNANLRDAKLEQASFDENTKLPDGFIIDESGSPKLHSWTYDTDMRRFTDPAHPDFWQPDWVKEQQKK